MAWIPAVAGAASSLIGDLFSQSGQQATNAQNMAMMLQNEQWQTSMSNTAMQRRVADLKAAGLNPLLAVSSGGAQVGSVGNAVMQNPNQAFGQLGNQVSSAMQAQAQLKSSDASSTAATASAERDSAEAARIRAITPGSAEYQAAQAAAARGSAAASFASVGQIQAQTDEIRGRINTLQPAQAAQLYASAAQDMAQVKVLNAQLPEILARIQTMRTQQDLNEATAKFQGMSADQIKALLPALQKIRQNEAITSQLGLQSADNENAFQSSFWGYLSHFTGGVIGNVTSAAGAALGGAAGSGIGRAAAPASRAGRFDYSLNQ